VRVRDPTGGCATSAGRTLSRSASTRPCAVSRPRANVTSNSIPTSETTTMLRTSKVRTKPFGRSAPFGRTTSERARARARWWRRRLQTTARPGGAPVEGDGPERRKQRPQDHRARLVETAEHDHPERGRDEDQKQLRRPQEGEASGPREHGEADHRSGDVGPRRKRHLVLTHDPAQAAPEKPGG
jgi:hypothetical protein